MSSPPAPHECCKEEKPRKWYQRLLFWAVLSAFLIYGLSFFISKLLPYRASFNDYTRLMAIPITLGFVIGGIVDHYIPQSYIIKFLAAHRRRTVFYAASLGMVAGACSHGILALSMELHKKGAPGPAVVGFLLASPWANLPMTILLIGFFGAKGILIIFGAFFIAISTGLALQALDRGGMIEKNRHSLTVAENFSVAEDFRKRWNAYPWGFPQLVRDIIGIFKGALNLVGMVLGWILIGMILASLVSAFVPTHLFHQFLGPSLGGLLMTLLTATVLEVCSEGTSPLAFEIYRQTGAFGNAFAFLMGGVVTDYTEIGLLWNNLGRRTALWTLGISLPQVLLLGWLFNQI